MTTSEYPTVPAHIARVLRTRLEEIAELRLLLGTLNAYAADRRGIATVDEQALARQSLLDGALDDAITAARRYAR